MPGSDIILKFTKKKKEKNTDYTETFVTIILKLKTFANLPHSRMRYRGLYT